MSLYFSLNKSSLGMLPAIFKNPGNADAAAALMGKQLKGITAALKPYSRALRSNRKRLGKKRK